MTREKILKKFKFKKVSVDGALTLLAKAGYCPALLNDDNGHWAVVFDGVQSVPLGKGDVTTAFFVEKHRWCKTISQALIKALKEDE